MADVAGRFVGYISAVDGRGWSLTLIGVESERYFGGDDKGSHSFFFNAQTLQTNIPPITLFQKIHGAFWMSSILVSGQIKARNTVRLGSLRKDYLFVV